MNLDIQQIKIEKMGNVSKRQQPDQRQILYTFVGLQCTFTCMYM